MAEWTRCGNNITMEKHFGRKVGHVLEFSPGRWHGFFDGNYVGRADTAEKAQAIVDARAKLYTDSIAINDSIRQASLRR